MGAQVPTVTFTPHMGFRPHTRTCVWTPWSVFQDGSYGTLQANTTRKADQQAQLRGRNRPWTSSHLFCNAEPKKALALSKQWMSGSASTVAHRSAQVAGLLTWHTPVLADAKGWNSTQRTEAQWWSNPLAERRDNMLALQRFQARLTLFPKYFAPFPHGTCSLSDSSEY